MDWERDFPIPSSPALRYHPPACTTSNSVSFRGGGGVKLLTHGVDNPKLPHLASCLEKEYGYTSTFPLDVRLLFQFENELLKPYPANVENRVSS
jgi:hypothetical protein